MKTKEELEISLEQFTGTESYHKFNPLVKNLVLTDGVKYLCENAGCYWLMDIIGSVQNSAMLKSQDFQTVKFTKGQGVVISDGDNNILYKQRVASSDFPLLEITLYVIRGENNLQIILLPSEY